MPWPSASSTSIRASSQSNSGQPLRLCSAASIVRSASSARLAISNRRAISAAIFRDLSRLLVVQLNEGVDVALGVRDLLQSEPDGAFADYSLFPTNFTHIVLFTRRELRGAS
jgi:hypothetical protein